MTERPEETAHAESPTESDDAPELETVMRVMWDRIDGLESQKRVLRRTVFGLGAAVLVVGISSVIAFQGARAAQAQGRLALTDGAGRVRARLDLDSRTGEPRLQLLDASGRPQAVLAAEPAGPALSFYGGNGTPRMRMALVSESPVLEVLDASGRHLAPVAFTSPAPPPPVLAPPSPSRRSTSRLLDARSGGCGLGALGCESYGRARYGDRG